MVEELWSWQDGTDKNDELQAALTLDDDSVVLAGFVRGDWGGEEGDPTSGVTNFAVVRLAANGSVIWRWQKGTDDEDDKLEAIAAGGDGSVVVAGRTTGSWSEMSLSENNDCAAAKLDATTGELLWRWQAGTIEEEELLGAASADDGSVVLAGLTYGDLSGTNQGSSDFAAFKVDSSGMTEWTWQNGTDREDVLMVAVPTSDGAFVLVGHSQGNWDGNTTPNGNFSFAAVKIDADYNEIWRWQDGTSGNDRFYGAAEASDGSIVMAGETEGDWAEENPYDVVLAAVKLAANGTELWRWQGTVSSGKLRVVIIGANDAAVLAGRAGGDWIGENKGEDDFVAVKLSANGTELWRWQDGTEENDHIYGGTSKADGSMVLVGFTQGGFADYAYDGKDMVAIALGVDSGATLTPTASPQTVAPSLPGSTKAPSPIAVTVEPASAVLPSSPTPFSVNDSTISPTNTIAPASANGSDDLGVGEPIGIGFGIAGAVAVVAVVAWVMKSKMRRSAQTGSVSDFGQPSGDAAASAKKPSVANGKVPANGQA